jgi:HAD superfamily hydrolase (TIGR01509 family)
MKAIAGLLVDMDGTLVDTAAANYEAYADALGEVGVKTSRSEFDRVATGRNWRQFLPAFLAEVPNVDPAGVAGRKAEIYPTKLALTRVNEALVSLIRSARPQWRTALVTTASAANVAAILDHHRLGPLFDTIVTGTDVSRHKPDPEAYFVAAARLGIQPGECLVVEDSDIGVQSAESFGALCLRISFDAA